MEGSEVHQFLLIKASWVCTRGTASRTQEQRFFSSGQCRGVIATERRRNRRIGGPSLPRVSLLSACAAARTGGRWSRRGRKLRKNKPRCGRRSSCGSRISPTNEQQAMKVR